jgi:hypothetical protein
MDRLSLVIIFGINMKTNFMIALNAQWKAPWRMPTINNQPNVEVPAGKLILDTLRHKLGETIKGVQDFVKKYWLYD